MIWTPAEIKPPILHPGSQYSIDLLISDEQQVHKGYYWNVRGEWRSEVGAKINATKWMELPLP